MFSGDYCSMFPHTLSGFITDEMKNQLFVL